MSKQSYLTHGRELGDSILQRMRLDPHFREQLLADADGALREAGLLAFGENAPLGEAAHAAREEACGVTIVTAPREDACGITIVTAPLEAACGVTIVTAPIEDICCVTIVTAEDDAAMFANG
jgi:hypothetical protein